MNKFETPKKIPYEHVELDYNKESQTDVSDHAIKIDQGKFLLAVNNPSELDLAFEISSSHNISFSIKPLYPNWICQGEGINQAKLSLASNRFNQSWPLIGGKDIVVDTNVRQGERLMISIANSQQKECGRAEITIERNSGQELFIGVFVVIWSIIFAVFIYLGIPIRFGAIGVALNISAIYANATISYLAFDISINTLALSISFIFLLILIHNFKAHRYINGALSTALTFGVLIVPLFCIGNYLLFAVPVSNDVIHALWQSDVPEVVEFIESNVSFWLVLVSSVALLFLWKFFSIKAYGQTFFSATLVSLIMLILALLFIPKQLSVNPMVKMFWVGTSEYFREIADYKEWKEMRKDSNPLPDAKLREKGSTVVVVLGESANKNHMSLYGYPRDTTPNVDRLFSHHELLKFSRAYASHSHTGGAVAHALTQADQYTTSSWTTAPSIITLSNSLGIETTWITNQQTFGAWDNQVSVLAEDASVVISKNKKIGSGKNADKYDGVMLPSLAQALEKNGVNKLIVMHLQGSHLAYCKRFPAQSSHFYGKPLLKSGFGRLALRPSHSDVNCYDDSISYTDHVIKEVMSLLANYGEPASLLYFSDHSEDVFGGNAHNSALFTYEMVEIPMYFWANEKWKMAFSSLWENLSINSDKVFTNDHIFETLSGILGIESKAIDSGNDLSSNRFEAVEEPLTLLGQKKLANIDNWRFWQDENTQKISSGDQCSKLLPHRTNTIGEIRIALSSGLCGFEIDVLMNGDEANSVFSVGHDLKSLTDTNLDHVLEAVPSDQASKIWLDIKSVNRGNIPLIINRLDYLDRKYKLKSKTIVETSYFGEQAELISEAGYQLSYYLPTGEVIRAEGQSDKERRKLAKELLRRIKLMKPSAISFDLKLYSFVKLYIEPSIPTDIAYHTWFPSDLNFSTLNLTEELSGRPYYQDLRVKTILIPYHSPFQY